MPFFNREEAGKLLADQLKDLNLPSDLVIFALPRGGVPIGYEIGKVLHAPLDVLVIRKVGAPGNPEYGMGAITEDGFYWIDPQISKSMGATSLQIRQIQEREGEEVERRIKRYRKGRIRKPISGRTILLVDDGLATGCTARTAAQYLKKQGASKIILAIPVGARESLAILKSQSEVDTVICLEEPELFFAVGQFYEDFRPVSDEEVVEILSCYEKLMSFKRHSIQYWISRDIVISENSLELPGNLKIPPGAQGVVLFAHGSGSSRRSPRNQKVSQKLNNSGIGTLLFDLLLEEEANDRSNVFDLSLLAHRLILATQWVKSQPDCLNLSIGYFGASTGAGAALWAAAELGNEISAIVSRGGRPDLAISKLSQVTAPTLLIVGEADEGVVRMNQEAQKHLKAISRLTVIPGATHLFEEPGALESVSDHATLWFLKHLKKKIFKKAA